MKITKKIEKKDYKMIKKVKTLGDLKKSKYISKTISEEMVGNLKLNLSKGFQSFQGIHGYEDTVIPDLERAII